MAKYSQAILILARQYRVPARVIQSMADNGVMDLDKLVNGSHELDGLITTAEAATKYHITCARIHKWIARNKVHPSDRRQPGIGHGGMLLLIPEAEVAELVANPPQRTGRPPKIRP